MTQGQRTITRLLRPGFTHYIWLEDKETRMQFMEDAEKEGFRFEDDVPPTKREAGDIMRIYPDKTLCFVGFVGHLAYHAMDGCNRQSVIRIDYKRYKAGEADFFIEREQKPIIPPKAVDEYDHSMMEGNTAFLVYDPDMQNNAAFFAWLYEEGFARWVHSPQWTPKVRWMYINMASMLYTIAFPGRYPSQCFGFHAVTVAEFQEIYGIFKKYQGLPPLQF